MTTTVYDQHAEFYVNFVDRGLNTNHYQPLLALMTHLIGARLRGARLCDLCCGEGYLGRHLFAHGAREVLGVDASAALLDRARQRANTPAITYRLEDAQALTSIADRSFDVVASQLALMDVADHRAMFAAVRRVLAPGGVFVFSTLHPCFKARPFHAREAPENLLDEGGRPIGVVVRRYASEGYFNSGGEGVRGHMGSYHRIAAAAAGTPLSFGGSCPDLSDPGNDPGARTTSCVGASQECEIKRAHSSTQ